MVLDSLAKSLRDALKKINKSALVDGRLVDEIVKEMQRALLMADVDVSLTLEITNNVERRAKEEPVPKNSNPRSHLIRIIYEELLKILGKPREFHLKPATIMLVGLYGQGKTTSAGKLARFYLKHGYKVVLIAADVQRAGAYEQLEQVSSSVGAAFFGIKEEKDSRKIVRAAMDRYRDWDVKIIDTSGRNAIDSSLTKEILDIAEISKPQEVILVLDASIGQQAGNYRDIPYYGRASRDENISAYFHNGLERSHIYQFLPWMFWASHYLHIPPAVRTPAVLPYIVSED